MLTCFLFSRQQPRQQPIDEEEEIGNDENYNSNAPEPEPKEVASKKRTSRKSSSPVPQSHESNLPFKRAVSISKDTKKNGGGILKGSTSVKSSPRQEGNQVVDDRPRGAISEYYCWQQLAHGRMGWEI